MQERAITLPELALIAGTRAALGAGVGLLLADRLDPEPRKAVGWTLVAVGIVTTVPLALEFFGKRLLPVSLYELPPSAACTGRAVEVE